MTTETSAVDLAVAELESRNQILADERDTANRNCRRVERERDIAVQALRKMKTFAIPGGATSVINEALESIGGL